MKKIGIDARLYSQTGVGVYIRNLLHYLEQINNKNFVFYIYLLKDDYNKVNFEKKFFLKKEANYFWHSFGEQLGFLKLINQDNLDLMHFTYFSYPVLYKRKFAATIHDLTPLFFKTGKASTKRRFIYELKHLVFKYVLNSQVKKARQIITPTVFVKKQLIEKFGIDIERKIKPIYEGVNYELKQAKENDLRNKYRGKFFIYIGNFYPHKNLINLIKAFSLINDRSYSLILIGPKDYFIASLLQFNIELKQEKRVVFHHTNSINDLVFFYKNAQALIHPSLSEGFGLPLAEAAYFNLPVIGSNIPAFKEILGNQYLSFDPRSVKDIKDKINLFIEEEPSFNTKPILEKLSFEKMTKETLNLYRNVLED